MEKRFVIMLQRIGITFVAVLLLAGCAEQEEKVNEAIDDVKVALVNAIDEIQQAVSGEAGVLVDQAEDAADEVQASFGAFDRIHKAVSGEAGVVVDQVKDAMNDVQASANTN